MRTFVDLKEMPDFNPEVKDGADSVSTGKVFRMVFLGGGPLGKWAPGDAPPVSGGRIMYVPGVTQAYPYCMQHGAMNKVSKDGIWRCLACGVGCYEVKGTDPLE